MQYVLKYKDAMDVERERVFFNLQDAKDAMDNDKHKLYTREIVDTEIVDG